jgi:hypothetical protein
LQRWPNQYYSSLKPAKIADVFNSPVCSLGTFKREAGENKARSVMVIILTDLVDFFNVSNTININQIASTTDLILDNYGWLKIDDFKLCFTQAKRGIYGAVYRIDGNIILSWIETYINDRINTADNISYAEYAGIKANESRSFSFQELTEKYVKKEKL